MKEFDFEMNQNLAISAEVLNSVKKKFINKIGTIINISLFLYLKLAEHEDSFQHNSKISQREDNIEQEEFISETKRRKS